MMNRMENDILNIPPIKLSWSKWFPWNNLLHDSRSRQGVIIPNGIPGVYEARYQSSPERLTIGKASDLRMRIRQGLVKGKTPHSAGKAIREKEDLSRIEVRWAVCDRPAAAEEELHRKYRAQFGGLPKYVKHT